MYSVYTRSSIGTLESRQLVCHTDLLIRVEVAKKFQATGWVSTKYQNPYFMHVSALELDMLNP